MVAFCQKGNITSIAEGIEEREELRKLEELGVCAGQGYLLAKPAEEVNLGEIIQNVESFNK